MTPETLLRKLRENLVHRKVALGIECLEGHQSLLQELRPTKKGAGQLVGYVAQWVDVGYDRSLPGTLLKRFPRADRANLSLLDYSHVRLAEGFVAMVEEDTDGAITEFEFVLSLDDQIPDQGVLAISSFWIGRCYRKQGRYDDALHYTLRARDTATGAGYDKMAAVMKMLESWLRFQQGDPERAWRILDEVETVLSATDDHMSLGNLYSARGRITQRDGRYQQSIEYFDRALMEYDKRSPGHRNVGRALTNRASVRQLIATQVVRSIDSAVARSEPIGTGRNQLERLREKALADLRTAEQIFGQSGNHHGLGNVMLIRGLLHLASGDFDGCASDADSAYDLGTNKEDLLLMVRARIVSCIVENAKFDEQVEELDDPSSHAHRALDYSKDAMRLAWQTQNNRLRARACIWTGLTLSNEFFNDTEEARKQCNRAAGLLEKHGSDQLWNDYEILRKRVAGSSSIDARLREWTEGHVGGRTFQELAEDFAGIIIPKVWEREGRKVSRVAKRLSISPKKIRRILAREGLNARKTGVDSESEGSDVGPMRPRFTTNS